MIWKWLVAILMPAMAFAQTETQSWIRINQLGYIPGGVKVAVWCGKTDIMPEEWRLVDAPSGSVVAKGRAGRSFGPYGPFRQTCRLDFSSVTRPGRYYLEVPGAKSPEFAIATDVYKGAADFCLRYMRQQRTGFNPFLRDSCHTHDGYVLYGSQAGIADSTHIDVVGGWHDASDYLQYMTTSANATCHLLMAYRDFPKVFSDHHSANGLPVSNGIADVLDEAKWGLDWLLKMHPREDQLFNQVGDDRDHMGMRLPVQDSFYGKGYERPVYFVNGKPQQRGRFMNGTTGTASTAGKVAGAFALAQCLYETDSVFHRYGRAGGYRDKALSAFRFGMRGPGYTQTASVRSPYIYAEENWVDDMELAAAAMGGMQGEIKAGVENDTHLNNGLSRKGKIHGSYLAQAFQFAQTERITPWLGRDTASHYQWYPFINIGHYELAREAGRFPGRPDLVRLADSVTGFYKMGIVRVWEKAKSNAFYRGIPFIWCSNNLSTCFAIQCYWYKELTGDRQFEELEQANFDWLFGCNPWGTSMVYGLPSNGDTPSDPHSAFTHLKNYPIDGGLVDGPVYTSIYRNLIGITLYRPDEYEAFQSDLAVYHDDYGDYSTNEPTMDGTASLVYLLAAKDAGAYAESVQGVFSQNLSFTRGAITRGDTTRKNIALVFTGDEFGDGGLAIAGALKKENVKASFFLTGRFYNNSRFRQMIARLSRDGHYLGPHSGDHLLYCDWTKRDSLLVTNAQFNSDLLGNLAAMRKNGVNTRKVKYFLPPYEWYNDTIADWSKRLGLQLINYTPGTLSAADYTRPDAANYRTSEQIYQSIIEYEARRPEGLNGFILLLHIGTDAARTDKFYHRLPGLLRFLKGKGYHFQTITGLLAGD